MILKMPFLNQVRSSTIILHLVRRGPSEMKIMKISWTVVLGRPGGMRGGAGRRYEECLRYTKDFDFRFDTPGCSTRQATDLIEGPLGRATPPPVIFDRHSCGSDRQKWHAHQDRPIDDDGLNWLDIC